MPLHDMISPPQRLLHRDNGYSRNSIKYGKGNYRSPGNHGSGNDNQWDGSRNGNYEIYEIGDDHNDDQSSTDYDETW